MFRYSLALLLVSLCCACQSQSSANPNAVRIMPLGDSITQGDRTHNSYRRPLWLKLQRAGFKNIDFVGSTRSHLGGSAPNPDFDQDHEGHWGWQVDEVLSRIDGWARATNPNIVLIHLGTNDVGGGEKPERAIAQLRDLIQALRKVNPQVKILLAQLIPIAGGEARIQQFNQQVAQLAKESNTPNSPVFLVDQFSGFNAEKDTYDGVHPNESGEQKIADRWFNQLKEILR
jgi:acyl-CoA thioesterase I